MIPAVRVLSWIKGWFAGPKVQIEPKPQVDVPPAPPKSARPVSAVEILQHEPDLTAAELAAKAGVTLSYARSLLRRQKLKAAPKRPERRSIKPPPAENVSVRNQVLALCTAGESASVIADQFDIGEGEVEFIAKVDKLAKAAAKKS